MFFCCFVRPPPSLLHLSPPPSPPLLICSPGKTTVARKMAKLMNALGLLATDRIVETSALDLTGEFVGASKKKVQEAMDAARGGVLFIDEAYALGGNDKYCKDAQDTLVQLMTDPRYTVLLRPTRCCCNATNEYLFDFCLMRRDQPSSSSPDTKTKWRT